MATLLLTFNVAVLVFKIIKLMYSQINVEMTTIKYSQSLHPEKKRLSSMGMSYHFCFYVSTYTNMSTHTSTVSYRLT